MSRGDLNPGSERVEELLANDQPGFFAAIGALDWYSATHRQWIEDQAFRSGDRVLEVGCATGTLTSYLADSGFRVTGLDRSDDMIRRARDDHPQLVFDSGDATMLPYDEGSFDAVVAASVINVVDDPTAVLSEARRMCAPRGTVSVLVPSIDFADEDLDALLGSLELEGFSRAALAKWHGSARKMGLSSLESLFLDAALNPTVIRTYLQGMVITATGQAR